MLQSDRLKILPLNQFQLNAYLNDISKLETELNLNHVEITLSPDLKEAFQTSILPNVSESNSDQLYFTLWVVIDKQKNVIAGGLLFTGSPNKFGEIEIGYGINPEFQGKGYASESVRLMIEWASNQTNVNSIIAKTDKNNFQSHRTLLKNKFVQISENETELCWKLDLDNWKLQNPNL